MSVNNLADHLQWLLSTKPFEPTARSPDYFNTGKTQESESITAPALNSQVNEDSYGSTAPLIISSNVAATPYDQAHEEEQASATMARLRTAPSPLPKPRLLAQQSCPLPDQADASKSPHYRTQERHSEGASDIGQL